MRTWTSRGTDAETLRAWDGIMVFWVVFWLVVGVCCGYQVAPVAASGDRRARCPDGGAPVPRRQGGLQIGGRAGVAPVSVAGARGDAVACSVLDGVQLVAGPGARGAHERE